MKWLIATVSGGIGLMVCGIALGVAAVWNDTPKQADTLAYRLGTTASFAIAIGFVVLAIGSLAVVEFSDMIERRVADERKKQERESSR